MNNGRQQVRAATALVLTAILIAGLGACRGSEPGAGDATASADGAAAAAVIAESTALPDSERITPTPAQSTPEQPTPEQPTLAPTSPPATPAPDPRESETAVASPPTGLVLLDHYDLDTDTGLREPSGLGLGANGRLWAVSDTGDTLFSLTFEGEITDLVTQTGLGKTVEGLTASGLSLWTVTEDGNRINEVDIATAEINESWRLKDLDGYEPIANLIESGGDNKGLEGIAVDSENGRILIVKEGRPGVLVEVSTAPREITDHWVLNEDVGFVDPDTDGKDLDFSGLSYDPASQLMWIVSDKGQRVFVFDLVSESVTASFAIDEVDKAEGIAVDRSTNRVYVVSEADATLYVYEIS